MYYRQKEWHTSSYGRYAQSTNTSHKETQSVVQQEYHLNNKYQSKCFHCNLNNNHTEYHYPHGYEKLHVPQVTRLDIGWLYQLHDHKDTDQPEDKELHKVEPLQKEHDNRDDSKPESKYDCGELFSYHQDSCIIENVIVPVRRLPIAALEKQR
jgi:hypothetical protein